MASQFPNVLRRLSFTCREGDLPAGDLRRPLSRRLLRGGVEQALYKRHFSGKLLPASLLTPRLGKTQWSLEVTMQRAIRMSMYICRSCGAEVAYPDKYRKCPVCGIKW